MKPYRKTGVAVGLLFLTATIAFYAADVLILGVLDGPDDLARAAAAANVLRTGALLLFLEGLAAVGIVVIIFPLLKLYNEPLALGYLGLRVGEFAAVLFLMAPPLLVVSFAEALRAGGLDASTSAHLAAVSRAQYWAAMAPPAYLCTSAAGTILAYVLYQSKLVPRPVAVLGAVGYPALLLGTVLELFELLELRQGVGLFLVWPVGLFELVFPIWLIVKGFNTDSIASSLQKHTNARTTE
jgi:hypothetical protein